MNKSRFAIVLAASIVLSSSLFAAAGESEKLSSSGEAALIAALTAVQALQPKNDPSARQKVLDAKLNDAVASLKIDEIRRLVAMGADPNASDGYHFTPLVNAVASHGDVDVMNALVRLGAKADLKGVCDKTAMHYAGSYGRLEAAQFLVAHHVAFDGKSCVGDTPLVDALANGHTEVASYFLSLGADPNASDWQGKTALMFALRYTPKRDDVLALILGDKRVDVNRRDNDGMTALKQVVKSGDADMVARLLQAPGIDVNDDGGGVTALFLAEVDHQDDIAALLRAAGAKKLVASR